MYAALFGSTIIVFTFMAFVFLIGQVKKDNSIVDIAWGLGFTLVSLYTLFAFGGANERQILITLLILLWSLRLSIFLFVRKKGKGEDFRYKEMRKMWGENDALHAFFKVYMLQAFLMMIVALPIIITNSDDLKTVGFLEQAGLALWCFGFVMETLADYEKYVFFKKASNRGLVLDTGLWKYCRHPNYFGESTMWWGIYFIAVSSRFGAAAVLSPLLLTILLLYVSGIPLLERREMQNPEYLKYMKKTPKFLPKFTLK